MWWRGKAEKSLVVLPQQEVLPPRGAMLDINANSHVMQGLGQQIASIGPNAAFTIEHENTGKGSKLTFSRTSVAQIVPPLPPLAASDRKYSEKTDEMRRVEKQLRKLRHELERAKFEHVKQGSRTEVNGIPCMLQKTANGYDLMRIGPDGQLEFMAHLGARVE